jgi:integrase
VEGKTIAELVEECMKDEQTVLSLARYSRKAYTWNLRRFAKWMCPEATPSCITNRTRPDYLAHVQKPKQDGGRGLGASSVCPINSSMMFFYNWLVDNPADEPGVETPKYLPDLPNDRRFVKLPKPRKPDRPSTTPEMVAAMVKAIEGIENEYHRLLLTAIITMFADIPLRKGELLNLKMSDVDLSEWEVKVLHGKGDKDRSNFLSDQGIEALKAYLAVRLPGADALWVHPEQKEKSASGKTIPRHVGDRWLYAQIRALAEAAGILETKKVRPHAFRRGTARRLYLGGVNLLALMRILGHTSLETTRIYIGSDDDELKGIRNIAPPLPVEPPAIPVPAPAPTQAAPAHPLPLPDPPTTPVPPDLLQRRRNNDWRNKNYDRR